MRGLRRRIFGFCIYWGLAASVLAAADFSRPKDYLGPTNPEGKINSWFELGRLDLSDGEALPFRLLFTASEQKGAPVFGKFWWCPLLESTIIAESEKRFVVSTLGGRRVALSKNAKGELSSGDGTWKGNINLAQIEITDPDGWKYTYQKGRLIAAEHGPRVRLKWIFAEDRPVAIEDEKGTSLLSLSYARNSAVPSAMTIGSAQYKITEQSVPVVVETNGIPTIAAFEPSLSGIVTPWRWWTFHVQLKNEGQEYQLDYSDTDTVVRKFDWAAGSGLLASDGDFTYFFQKRGNLAPMLSRKNADGQIEAYFYDAKTGISEHLKPDGERVVRSYFVARGPTQKLLRKLTRYRDGKEFESVQWSYDEQGRLLRVVNGDFEQIFERAEGGQLLSVKETDKGEIYREKKYDLAGNLLSNREGRQVFEYHRSGSEVVMKKIVDGKPLFEQTQSLSTGKTSLSRVAVEAAQSLQNEVRSPQKTENGILPQLQER